MTDYGLFTVAYTLFLLVATFHTALLTEPMLIFGSGKYNPRLSRYLGVVSIAHWLGMSLFSVLFAGLGMFLLIMQKEALANIIWTLACTGPLILFLWTMRRACYVRQKPHIAGYAGMMYLILMVVQVSILYQEEALSAALAFGVLGSTSIITAIWLGSRLEIEWPLYSKDNLLKLCRADHWSYGRWSVMTGVLMWVPGQVFYFVLPLFVGLEQCAGLRAISNLILPYVLLCTALGTILIPELVKAQGRQNFENLIRKYSILLVGGGFLYWLGIGLGSKPLIALLYNGLYVEYSSLLWILGGLPVFTAIIAVFGAVHRARQRPAYIFWSYVSSTTIAITLGIGLIAQWGIHGAVSALIVSYAITAAILLGLYLRDVSAAQKGHDQEAVWA